MTLHFAYGSNMSRTHMRVRCPAAREVGTAILPGYRFVITADGYASVRRAQGHEVHGLLWRLTPRDRAALNAYEDLADGLYRAVTLPVRAGGRRLSALVYVAASTARGMAKPGYFDVVVAAARDINLPAPYVRSLEHWRGGFVAARARAAGEIA